MNCPSQLFDFSRESAAPRHFCRWEISHRALTRLKLAAKPA